MSAVEEKQEAPSVTFSVADTKPNPNHYGKPRNISVKGRHDISAIPRINVVCEAMVTLVLADHQLRQRAIQR